ncbi:hypothetical protein D9619_005148 [Psilocybe cf. subviscida]|uniref:HMG box domain-containing protein n=1 Tax=Psilocybe cf. subviscida TaxID=2480587 RepID=A0A8H5BQZ6_9AGAR|nr:hypothetical protein D9619_005148 [Psilocybe cf. subviscida]
MPADRTKTLKRSDSDESLAWQTPETENTFTIETWTPWADSDVPPPLVDAPPYEADSKPLDFILFPPPDSAPSGAPAKRAPHSKKKPASHIPRPPNAFILFRSSFIKSQAVSTAVETNHSTLSKIIGLTWAGLAEDERKIWFDKAKEALEEHRKRFPGYAFRPVQARGGRAAAGNSNGPGGGGGTGGEGTFHVDGQKTEKRRVREVEPKDIKRCTKIAQLLVEGKKGAELNAAVAEFDRTHVPQIITRFEAPITERAFRRPSIIIETGKTAPVKAASTSPRKVPRQRRSSSAPVEDTARTRNNGSFLQKVVAHGKSAAAKKQQRSATPAGTTMTVNSATVFAEEDVNTFDAATFNFSSFSFDAMQQQQQLYAPAPCDPLAAFSPIDTSYSSPAPYSPAPYSPVAHVFHAPSPALSINTNTAYLTHHNQEDWTSAPGSPFTPTTMGSPMPSQFLEFDAGAHSQSQSPMPFTGALDMNFDAYGFGGAFEPMQQQQQQVQYKEPTTEQAIFAAFQQHQSANVMTTSYDGLMPQFGALDMEFGAFMMNATAETGYAL